MRVKVNSLWQGKVGIHEKYINELRKTKEDLQITCENRTMTMSYQRVMMAVNFGKETFRDKYSGAYYRLAYFNWKPNDHVQLPLFEIKNEKVRPEIH